MTPLLAQIYRESLRRAAPGRLVAEVVSNELPAVVVAIGKCAGRLLDGFANVHAVDAAIAVIPRGYPEPSAPCEVHHGWHPDLTEESFEAGEAVRRFVRGHRSITFLISGGGSAAMESPLSGLTRAELREANRCLLDAGIAIESMNIVRKHLSAVKGGRLAESVPGRSVSLIYSDVKSGDLAAVASGPTLPDTSTNLEAAAILEQSGGSQRLARLLRSDEWPETPKVLPNASARLIADNQRLLAIAREVVKEHGYTPHFVDPLETPVSESVNRLIEEAAKLREGEVLITGGEPLVTVRGSGRGGRCCEMAARFAMESAPGFTALFGTSDGVDGNSGISAILLPAARLPLDRDWALTQLADSNSVVVAERYGEAIMMAEAGNNLRDLYLLARG